MAETLRIEIPIETVDETEPELSNIVKNMQKLEKASNNANQSVQKASKSVSKFDKQAEKTQKSLSSWAKEKYQVLLEAKDKITPLLGTIGSGLRSFGSKTWSVTMKAVDLVTSPVRGIINLLKNPIFQVGAVLGVSIGLKDTIETYKSFEAAMSNVSAISGATGDSLDKLTAKAKDLGAQTKFTATEVSEGYSYMAMAGWDAQQMLDGIEGVLSLAAASGEDLSTTSDIVTDALTAFNKSASDAGEFADVLAAAASSANTTVSGMGETFKYAGTMAGTLGYSIQDVALMTGLMANAGVKGTMSGTALNSIFTRLSTNTNGAADAMKGLGVEFYDAHGNARDLSDVMGELRAATAGMNNEEKTAIANKIAGTQAQKGLLAILNASTIDYNKLSEAIENADGAAAEMADTMLDNLSGSITLLQSAVDGVQLSFGERLAPYVRSLADYITKQTPAITEALDELMDWVDRKADVFKKKIADMVGTDEWQDADIFGKIKIAWDEIIADPFSEWWNSEGKQRFADFASDSGQMIGTGFKLGILTLLGIDVSDSLDAGVSIGASFAQGFADGFYFEAISSKFSEGMGNIVKNAAKLLPCGESADLSSLMSAALLMKIASPMVTLGKGGATVGKALFGKSAETGTSMMGSLLGSAAMGTGLLGKSSMLAINLGAGNLAGGASLGAGALAGIGMGAMAGGLAGGATLVSGALDAYHAVKSEDKKEKAAYGKSAGWKAGGVAAGAAAGAAIGSFIPVLGTAAGALIGAGIGGIAGWAKGKSEIKEYEENVKELEEQAQIAQKALDVTGIKIDDVKFSNSKLNDAMKDTEVSTEKFALMFQESCANVMEESFGDIKLSLAEVKELADHITFGGMSEGLSSFAESAETVNNSLARLQSAQEVMKKADWKASLGLVLTEAERDDYKEIINEYVSSAQQYIEDNHYEATVALKLLGGKDVDTGGLDSMYNGMKQQVSDLSKELTEKVAAALEDGVISTEAITLPDGTIQLSEAAEIQSLQEQIAEITNQLSQAQQDASLQALKIRYSGAELDAESFASLQTELQNNVDEIEAQLNSALEISLTNLNLQLSSGTIDQEAFNEQVSQLTADYQAKIDELQVTVQNFQLESIAEAYSQQLDNIMPDIEGTTTEKLAAGLKQALQQKPDISSWDTSYLSGIFNFEGMDAEIQQNLTQVLSATALTIPDATVQEWVNEFNKSGTEMATGLTAGVTAALMANLHSETQKTINSINAVPYSAVTKLDVTLQPNIVNPGAIQSSVNALNTPSLTLPYSPTKHAAGGYVNGPQLSWLAEEGYGEFVIPTDPRRRSRALELYEQAGEMLGIAKHADGGYIAGFRGSNMGLSDSALNSIGEVLSNAPLGYSESTDISTEAITPVVSSEGTSSNGVTLQVSVNMNPEFNISGSEGQSEDAIMATIRRHMKELADELGGEIADKLDEVFSNMPLATEG